MIIVLIILLTAMNLALRLSIAGVELSYQVGKRVDNIRKRGEKKVLKKHKVLKGLSNTANIASRVSVKTISMGAKSVLKVLIKVTSILRNLLCTVFGIVMLYDILVFIIIVAIVGAYNILLQ